MRWSDNGWPQIAEKDTVATVVPGTDLTIRTAPAAQWILCKFAELFNQKVEPITGPTLDDWSYAPRNVRGSLVNLSCHATGTAIDLNALSHPRGVHNTFSPAKLSQLRKLLEQFTIPSVGVPCIKWGADFRWPSEVDPMHFQIRGTKADLLAVQKVLEENEVVSKDDIAAITAAVMDALEHQKVIANPGVNPGDKPGADFSETGILQNIETTQDVHTGYLKEIIANTKK